MYGVGLKSNIYGSPQTRRSKGLELYLREATKDCFFMNEIKICNFIEQKLGLKERLQDCKTTGGRNLRSALV